MPLTVLKYIEGTTPPTGGLTGLYETLISQDRPTAWWGLDTAHPLLDDTGKGYDLTVVGAPADAASLLTRGDGGEAGCRNFDGAADAYYVLGTLTDPPAGPPPFHASATGSGSTADSDVISPAGVLAGDLLLVCTMHTTAAATISAAPAGWTQVGSTLNATSHAAAVYKRTASSADTTQQTYRWTWDSAANTAVVMLVYRGLDTGVAGLIYDSGQQATASDAFHVTTSETFPVQSGQVVFWTKDSTATVTPFPTGLNSRATAANGNLGIRAVDYHQASAGSGTRTAVTSANTTLGAFLLTFGSPNIVRENTLDARAEKISIHALINPDTVAAGTRTIVRKQNAWGLHLNGATVEFVYRDGGGVDRTVTGPTVSASATTHLVVTDDGTNIHFYKNGAETTSARTGAAGYTTNTNRVTVGAYHSGTYGSFFDGRIDELAIYAACISDQMVATYYTASVSGTFGGYLTASTATPRGKLEIAWASNPTDETLVWEDMSSYLRAGTGISTQRGRNFELDRIETGRMDFTLSNRNREFDATFSGSPFYPYVRPTRPVRFRAQAETDGVVYGIFFGYIESWPLKRDHYGRDSVAQFTAADVFKALSLDKINGTTVRDTELAGARISALLEDVPGIPYSGDTGQHEVIGDDLQNVNRLEHAQAVAETDGGVLFANGLGEVVYQDNHYRAKNERTVRATYGDGGGAELPVKNLEPMGDESRLFTAASVTPASGNVKRVEDATAVLEHFVRTKDVSTLHASDNDAQAMAEAFADRYATPRTRIPDVRVQPSNHSAPSAMWATVLAHEISHRVKTVERPIGDASSISREHFVEGIAHSLSGSDWQVSFSVSPADLDGDYWLLGTGELDDASGLTSTALGW
jgi:hypothetical protein